MSMMISHDYGESRERRIYSVVIGIVTNNRDPEGMGRVKVNFPWRGI
ncbi:MAG: phage tail protein, partial [Methanophagales archaeon ANME-1-THS]